MNSIWGDRYLRGARGDAQERIHFCFPGWPKTACGVRWKVPMDEWNLTYNKLDTNCTSCKHVMSILSTPALWQNSR